MCKQFWQESLLYIKDNLIKLYFIKLRPLSSDSAKISGSSTLELLITQLPFQLVGYFQDQRSRNEE